MIIVYLPIILTMLYLGGVKLRDILILIFSGLISILFGVLGLGNKLAELFFQISKENVTAEGAIKLENLATGLSYVGSWFGDYLVILPFAALMLAFALINYFIWRRNRVRFFEIVMAVCLTVVIGIMGSIAFRSVIYDYHLSRMVATVAQSMDIGYVNQDIGYQTDRSIKAIGAGGAYGAGYLAGRQKEGEFVPERTTDFIFTVIGEETGFKGTLLLFFLYFLIGARGLYISYITRNRMGSLVAGGLTIMITFQAAINLASCTGIFPVAGLPLPFLSAGGSSLITLMFSVGLLMNVNSHRFYH
jgi:rod shape determining protein RodA